MPSTYLNTMANYDERTIERLTMSVSKKFHMGLPENGHLHFAEWNLNNNYIAAGGAQGLMRVVKIGMEDNKAPTSLIVNQTLDGHNSTVISATWNEKNQKLTTSDTSGLIIVWGIYNESWFEEMINNRNKSVVVGICWNNDGTKIAIAYADGSVIVGTLEGTRVWNKELEVPLAACEWAPEGKMLVFGTADGKVIVYDDSGNHHLDINMVCLESVELEQALAREPQKEEIVCMRYWSPTPKSKPIDEIQKERETENEKGRDLTGTAVFTSYPKNVVVELVEEEEPTEPFQPIPPERPRFMVAFARGLLQIMRSVSDPDPVVVRIPEFKITGARWSPNGAFIAVCGQEKKETNLEQVAVYFFTAYGQEIGYFQANECSKITGICWEATGLRMTIAADGILSIGNIRPEFKCGGMEEAIVYVFQKEELHQYCITFYDHKTDEKNTKVVTNFEQLAFYREHCVIVNKQDEDNDTSKETYFCQLCNNIGTTLDYKTTTVPPKFACVNGMSAVIASEDRYFIWHFVLPKYNSVQAGIYVPGKSGEYLLEEKQRPIEYGTKRLIGGHRDEICAMTIGDTFFLIALKVGGIYQVSLADGVITKSFRNVPEVCSMKLNCKNNRLAVVVPLKRLPFSIMFYEFGEDDLKKTYGVERKEVWGFEWDAFDENMLAFKERNKLFVCDGSSVVEQSIINGNIVAFQNLIVTSVNFEKILMTPENPPRSAVQEVPVKAKLDVAALLSQMNLNEAFEFAERNPHAELWVMVAQYALFKHHFDIAEHGFVKLGDYEGIELVKKLRNIQSNELRNAEITAFIKEDDLETAKALFIEADRKDLAVEMYKKIDDYNAVLELIKNDEDELAKMDAYRHIAENHEEQLEWDEAAENYEKCGDRTKQIECLINANEFGKLESISRDLSAESEHLEVLGDAFTSRGWCDQAVECFLKKGLPHKALNSCVELNQWQKAHFIAEVNNLENVEGLLGKYAVEMKAESDEKSLSALALYMRAERHLDAAKIVFDIAKDRQMKFHPEEELKECYVLGAILVEQHRQSRKELKKLDKNNVLDEVLDDESGLSAEQSRILENTWKGAEAFHFMMLAQQHFFDDHIEDALQTSVILSDYEEYLDPAEIYSMIALAAANVNQFGICSKAMMRLETLDLFEEQEREEMRTLSFLLFSEYVPTNPNSAKVNCPSCDTKIDPYDLQCHECHTKFPVCIASGRLIIDNVFWLCPRCKHRAHQHEIIKYSYCPLCHDVESFKKT